MTHQPATEAIVAHAEQEAWSIAEKYGWKKSYPKGVLKAYLTIMEQENMTPTEFARRRGWIE